MSDAIEKIKADAAREQAEAKMAEAVAKMSKEQCQAKLKEFHEAERKLLDQSAAISKERSLILARLEAIEAAEKAK